MPAMELNARTGWIVSPPVKETWRLSNWIKKSSNSHRLYHHMLSHWLRKRKREPVSFQLIQFQLQRKLAVRDLPRDGIELNVIELQARRTEMKLDRSPGAKLITSTIGSKTERLDELGKL